MSEDDFNLWVDDFVKRRREVKEGFRVFVTCQHEVLANETQGLPPLLSSFLPSCLPSFFLSSFSSCFLVYTEAADPLPNQTMLNCSQL